MHHKLQAIVENSIDNKLIFGCSFAIQTPNLFWEGAAGNFSINDPFFIASTTKLFTTAIIMHLRSKGQLALSDNIVQYLPLAWCEQLHVYRGVDCTGHITIQHLLAHTSGLPDYFQDKNSAGHSLETSLKMGVDEQWDVHAAIRKARECKTHFIPGAPRKAHYSDLNFQLLGHIIETVTKQSYETCCKEFIFQPLALSDTYLYSSVNDSRPKSLYYQGTPLHIPNAMISFGPDGGIVSTSRDLLSFLQAFFTGQLFPMPYLEEMQQWNAIFFPMKSGIGIHQFKLPWIFNPFGTVPSFIGHSGLSGALAYYEPQKQVFIAGTVNQIASPSLSFRTMIKLYLALSKIN